MRSSECIDEYTHFLSDVRHRSRNTVDAYHRDLVKYAEFVASRYGVDIISATDAMTSAYIGALKADGKSDSTILRAVTSIRSFRLFITGSKPSLHAASAIERPKAAKNPPAVLTKGEIESLLCAPPADSGKGIRDKAMIELLYATGIRVSELIGLDITDINTDMCFVRCCCTRGERVIPIGRTAAAAAEYYIRKVRPDMVKGSRETALFVNKAGARMTRQGFWKILKHYGEEAGISCAITPHTLRHSFAAHLVQNGADLESIREMMGHATIASTKIYSMIPNERIRSVYQSAHPRA